jgi:TatD DNase family protein
MPTNIRLIDTHMHLHVSQFDDDRSSAIERAGATGVARMIEVGYDLASSRAAIALAEEYPQIYAAVGIQPHYAGEADSAWLAEVRRLAAHPKAVAIGEIGLDYYHDRAPRGLQEQLFREQLSLARELGKPVVIHSREAQADTVRILRDAARGQPGVMHSFSGDWAYAEACLEVGFTLSFSGPLTFAKATDLHGVARAAPLNRILTETDSPYLAPHPLRGRRNEPANVRLVAERLAQLRGTALGEIAEAVWQNAAELFGLPAGDARSDAENERNRNS